MKKQIKKRIVSKLKSKKGESLVEVLVAIVIGMFSILMLTSVISTSTKLDAQSRALFSAYYEEANRLASIYSGHINDYDIVGENVDPSSGEKPASELQEVTPTEGVVKITGQNVTGTGFSYKVDYFENDVGNAGVIAYKQK